MNRRSILAIMAFPVFAASAWSQTATTLREAAEAIGLNIGVATNSNQVSNATSEYATALKTQFNLVVCENEMKFDGTEPSLGRFTYGGGDGVSAFAVASKMKMRGHNFIWHSQATAAQAAVHDRASGLKVMRDHITAVGGHFKEQILEWDVLNEIVDNTGLRNATTRPSSFWDANIGDDYADSALAISRQVLGTNGYLYYNDYGADGVNTKSTTMFNLAKKWQTNKVPIDGIGLQSHLGTGIRKDDISANVKRFGDIGLRISMTEIDITSSKTEDWVNLLKACIENYNCVSFVTWGLSDDRSWLGSGCHGCLLFSGTATPKTEIIQALIQTMAQADPTVTAKRKEFIKRLPGATTSILYPLARSGARREGNGLFGAFPVPVFSNGSGKSMDALGRNILAPAKGSFPGLGILPQ